MIGILYNYNNKLKMENEYSSIVYQKLENVHLINIKDYTDLKGELSKYDLIITEPFFNIKGYYDGPVVIIISHENYNDYFYNKPFMVQYESKYLKEQYEKKKPWFIGLKHVIINCMPRQKLEINPLSTQDSTIFFCGADKKDDTVDQMFTLDTKIHYKIEFYNEDTDKEPSKLHKLSWNVSTDKNLKGVIRYKIINEIENGCLPILLYESKPEYFFEYPFLVTFEELNNENLLIDKIKSMSEFIGRMTRDDFKKIVNSVYNSIYVGSSWNYNFFLIAREINRLEFK